MGSGHFGGGMGGGHVGGGHFGGGRGFAHGRLGPGSGLGAPFGYYDGYDDDSCWPLDRTYAWRYVC
jgi:hypothetical protein